MIGKAFFALAFGVAMATPLISHAATLTITPGSGTFEVGDRVTYKVQVSGEQPLNAVAGTVVFPSGLFSIESVSKTGSILNFWVTEPTFSKGAGTVQFEGVALSGFVGGTGTVVTVTLRALKVGSGSVAFQSGQVLANDGQGTDITSGLNGATFTIVPAPVRQNPPATPTPKQDAVIEREVTAPEVLRSAPEIRLGTSENVPAIFGFSGHAKSEVLLTFVPLDGQRLFITGTTNEQGQFILSVPRALREGPYAVTAVIVLPDRSQSEASLPLTVEVGGTVAGALSYQTTTYASLIALLALIPLFFYFLWRKLGPRRHVHQEVRKEIREAQDTLHKSFVLIREDVRKHHKKSEGRSRDGSVSNDDISDIEDSLDDAEVMIEKEIQDIAMVDIDEDK